MLLLVVIIVVMICGRRLCESAIVFGAFRVGSTFQGEFVFLTHALELSSQEGHLVVILLSQHVSLLFPSRLPFTLLARMSRFPIDLVDQVELELPEGIIEVSHDLFAFFVCFRLLRLNVRQRVSTDSEVLIRLTTAWVNHFDGQLLFICVADALRHVLLNEPAQNMFLFNVLLVHNLLIKVRESVLVFNHEGFGDFSKIFH